ncbi:ATP-binding protein [Candidatus Odyssella thessalonicensis]|uniref:ATP-binding protein n=1 Tax=Candidatus Odyssella thessalonicensis TaxID=84647 RepID=UPI000225B204|nr:ATP-binding protein [Candidatus Odyssella thessalonicensis]
MVKKVIFSSILLYFNLCAGENAFPGNLLSTTDYEKAFDPTILQGYVDVLMADGSIENMPEDLIQEKDRLEEIEAITSFDEISYDDYLQQRQLMVNSLKEQLRKEKRSAVLRPLKEGALYLAFDGISTSMILSVMSPESVGGGFGLFNFLSILGVTIKNSTHALYQYFRPDPDPLSRWEDKFCELMPYIPSALWQQIREKFTLVRNKHCRYSQAAEFFDIVFNLPMLHRYPYTPPLSLKELKQDFPLVHRFIGEFFKDYEQADPAISSISSTCRTYLRKLALNEDGFVCLYLEGSGGIGKTYFAKKLVNHLNKVSSHPIPMQEITLKDHKADTLEGSSLKPGQVLSALSRIGKESSPFGILIFDEATWLNGSLNESAKRLFEPTLGSFSADYLEGLQVSFKGFLLIFISNKPIEDEALKSRFIHVPFPKLKKERLVAMARATLSNYIIGTPLRIEDVENALEIEAALEQSTTMRDVTVQFPIAIEKVIARKHDDQLTSSNN